jgi:hypothetical protein
MPELYVKSTGNILLADKFTNVRVTGINLVEGYFLASVIQNIVSDEKWYKE